MKKGSDVFFYDLRSAAEIKILNDVVNYILSELRKRFDLENICGQKIFTAITNVKAGEWSEIKFEYTFEGDPAIFVYAENGCGVKIENANGENNKRKKCKVMFTDESVSGTVNIAVIGNVIL